MPRLAVPAAVVDLHAPEPAVLLPSLQPTLVVAVRGPAAVAPTEASALHAQLAVVHAMQAPLPADEVGGFYATCVVGTDRRLVLAPAALLRHYPGLQLVTPRRGAAETPVFDWAPLWADLAVAVADTAPLGAAARGGCRASSVFLRQVRSPAPADRDDRPGHVLSGRR